MVLLGWLAAAGDAGAQTASRISLAIAAGAITVDADQAEGTTALGGVAVGVRLRPWVDLEAEVGLAPGAVTREFTGPLIAFGPPASSFDEFESRAVIARVTQGRETQAVYAVGVRLHPPSQRRVRPEAFVGLTGHRVRDTRRVEVLALPPGVSQADVDRALPSEPPWTRHVGGVTVGGGLAIALTPRLSVTPDVRYDFGSFGDEINNALRTTVRVTWHF
jgi:hypothetical protein